MLYLWSISDKLVSLSIASICVILLIFIWHWMYEGLY